MHMTMSQRSMPSILKISFISYNAASFYSYNHNYDAKVRYTYYLYFCHILYNDFQYDIRINGQSQIYAYLARFDTDYS